MKKPDEHVADNIMEEFKRLGLLSDDALAKLKPKLPIGALSAADWKLLFEVDRLPNGRPQ